MTLNRKIGKDFKDNLLKNISLLLLIIISISIIVGFNRSMDGYIYTVDKLYSEENIEEGFFSIYGELDSDEFNKIEDKGFELQRNHFKDYKVEESTIRVMDSERKINSLKIINGEKPEKHDEIVIDYKYAEVHKYKTGDIIRIGEEEYRIVGFGITPDYLYTIKNLNDFLNNPLQFGVGYLKDFKAKDERASQYSYKLRDKDLSEKEIKDKEENLKHYLEEKDKFIEFIAKKDNPRIQMVYDDVSSPKKIALIMGSFLFMTIIFMTALSVANSINEDRVNIGILFSQGYRKMELLMHYIIIPIGLSVIGTVIGYIVGMLTSKPLTHMQTEYNIPEISFSNPLYLIFAGVIVPIILTIIISVITINSVLKKEPLVLLYGETDDKDYGEMCEKNSETNFFLKFRTSGIKKEIRMYLILIAGVFLASSILNTAFFMRDSSRNYVDSIGEKIPYDRIYTLYFPTYDLDGGEKTAIKQMKLKLKSADKDEEVEKTVSLQGIEEDSKFFDIRKLRQNEVSIASCIHNKFGINIGDKIKVDNYEFVVKKIMPYDLSQNIFMPLKEYNKLLDNEDNYFNGVIASKRLNLDEDSIQNELVKADAISSADDLLDMIMGMSRIMIIASSAIVILVVYILLSILIRKSRVNISMMQVFGYRQNEVESMYLRGNILFLIIPFILSLFSAKKITTLFYNSVFSNSQQYFKTYIRKESIIYSAAALIFAYIVVNLILKKSFKDISFADVIKNRE